MDGLIILSVVALHSQFLSIPLGVHKSVGPLTECATQVLFRKVFFSFRIDQKRFRHSVNEGRKG